MQKRPEIAVLAVTVTDTHALLVQRKNPPDAKLWGFPGGRVEFGERLTEAAARELLEETGVTAQPVSVMGHMENLKEGFHYVMFGVLCKAPEGAPVAADDALQAAWVPISDINAGRLPLSDHVGATCAAAQALMVDEGPPND
ncbi:MAG: NUDIX hydrolase [Pseudoruegeria sp.]